MTNRPNTIRWCAAIGVLVSALVHLYLWATGMSAVSVIGPLFLLNAVGGIVIAAAVLLWRHPLPMLGAAGFGALTLIAFYLSVTVGLFGLHETIGGPFDILAQIAEIVAVIAGVMGMVKRWQPTPT